MDFYNEIEDVHSLKHTSGYEGDKGVARKLLPMILIIIDDEKEGHSIDRNSDELVLVRSKYLPSEHIQVCSCYIDSNTCKFLSSQVHSKN